MAEVALPNPFANLSATTGFNGYTVTLPPGDHVRLPQTARARLVTIVPTVCDGGTFAAGDIEAQLMRTSVLTGARLVEQAAIYRKPTALDGAAGAVGYVAQPFHDLAVINTTGAKTITVVIGVCLG